MDASIEKALVWILCGWNTFRDEVLSRPFPSEQIHSGNLIVKEVCRYTHLCQRKDLFSLVKGEYNFFDTSLYFTYWNIQIFPFPILKIPTDLYLNRWWEAHYMASSSKQYALIGLCKLDPIHLKLLIQFWKIKWIQKAIITLSNWGYWIKMVNSLEKKGGLCKYPLSHPVNQ